MLSSTRTFALDGISARPVRVEVDVHRGLPGFTVVGLPDMAVREARERVRAALVNCGFEFPLRRIVVNLAPASLRRAGPGMDLAIAVALLSASGQIRWNGLADLAFVGELALGGATRAINGAVAIAEAARDAGATAIVLPAENAPEGALVAGIDVIGLDTLSRLPQLAVGEWKPEPPTPLELRLEPATGAPDLADLRGQPELRYALEVAAGGGHGLLIAGPPGSGKSLAAARLPSILPRLSGKEALEVARIASACGRLAGGVGGRPLRAPHHTISPASLVGGGTPPRPGEVTLAHRGVLFLDELCEFRRDAIEALGGPLESGEVSIAGAGGSRRLPSRVLLVAAANPCPCGRGETDVNCTCSPSAIRRYQTRLGGALVGAIDILVAANQPSAAELGGEQGEPSASVRERVESARRRQERRLGLGRCNAEMTSAEARGWAIDASASALLVRQSHGSREHLRVLRLARTIADLADLDVVGESAVTRALQLVRRNRT